MIVFTYKIADFFNNSQILSLIRTNSMLEKGNENSVDDFSINDEDEPLVKKYLKSGSALVANVLSGYTKDLINSLRETIPMEGEPFEFDVTVDTDEHLIVFRVNMPENWPVSATTLVDQSIIDALENYVLYRISKQKMIEGETYFSLYDEAIKNIRSYIHRRTETITRSKSLF